MHVLHTCKVILNFKWFHCCSIVINYSTVGDVFSIERRQYFTSEADDSVEVCVLHDSGELREPVKLTVCTTPGTAISNIRISKST